MKALLAVMLFLMSCTCCGAEKVIEGCDVSGNSSDVHQLYTRKGNQGCCSHHGGVCGCGGVALRCCDGSTSPSCGCHGRGDKPGVNETRPPEGELPYS